MRLVELFELQSRQGPCQDCFRTGRPVVNRDLTADDPRWPRFAAVAVGEGFRAADAIPMRLRTNIIGALNLFRSTTGSLNEDDVAAAQALADIATIAIVQHRTAVDAQVLNEQLSEALTSRIVIEQAKGMIGERRQVPMEEAFVLLRHHARRNNRRLADVARSIVDGTIDPSSLDPPPS
jgi:GAF domain-containing protein